jgi:hypothetical protein
MASKRTRLTLEQLEDRVVMTTAVLSNGVLTVVGDNLGNNINVYADAGSNIHVSERGQEVAITGSSAATLSNVAQVVELAGTGSNNQLATDATLLSIATVSHGNGSGVAVYAPGNNGPSTAFGSSDPTAINHFLSNPGGKDVFQGGRGYNLFDWQPGTGTDIYYAGKEERHSQGGQGGRG